MANGKTLQQLRSMMESDKLTVGQALPLIASVLADTHDYAKKNYDAIHNDKTGLTSRMEKVEGFKKWTLWGFAGVAIPVLGYVGVELFKLLF